MPGTRCAVYRCKNTYGTNRGREVERKIIMHRFPKAKDLVSQGIRTEWVTQCRRADTFNPDNSRICSEHFAAADYERDVQHELLGLPLKRLLKKTAIPTLNLAENLSKQSKSHQKRIVKKRKREHDCSPVEDQSETKCFDITNFCDASTSETSEYVEPPNISSFLPGISSDPLSFEIEYRNLLEQYNTLRSEYVHMQQEFRKQIESLSTELKCYKSKFGILQPT